MAWKAIHKPLASSWSLSQGFRVQIIDQIYSTIVKKIENSNHAPNPLQFWVQKQEMTEADTVQMNICFWGCCHEDFGFCDNGLCFNNCSMLGRDGIHLSIKGKRIVGSSPPNLVRWALNERTRCRWGPKSHGFLWGVDHTNQCSERGTWGVPQVEHQRAITEGVYGCAPQVIQLLD